MYVGQRVNKLAERAYVMDGFIPREKVTIRFVGYAIDYRDASGTYLGTIDHLDLRTSDDEALAVATRRMDELGAERAEVWQVKNGIRPVGEVSRVG